MVVKVNLDERIEKERSTCQKGSLGDLTNYLLKEVAITYKRNRGKDMEKQTWVFEQLKEIKDYWVNITVEGLDTNADRNWPGLEEEYRILQKNLQRPEEKAAYQKAVNEVVEGVMHSILVMIDGGDALADKMMIDLIERDTGESLSDETALHEEFIGYLIDTETD